MKSEANHWTKIELEVYILLLCANADSQETEEEIEFIKSKVDDPTFNKMYSEFSEDTEDDRFDKIQHDIEFHEYSGKELQIMRREMHGIFLSDKKFGMMEKKLDEILDNILY